MRQRPASPHRRKRAVWADRVTRPESKAPAAKPAPLADRELDIVETAKLREGKEASH